jgi:hypothetical protein
MKFGTRVWVNRGSTGNPPGTPGCVRLVKGILVGAQGCNYRVRLQEDDPLATVGYCLKKGDTGWWSESVVTARVEP